LCLAWAAAAAPRQEPAPAQLPEASARGAEPIALHPFSRSWVDEQGGRRIDDVEASAPTLPWVRRKAEQSDRIEGHALWIQFDVFTGEPDQWFVEVGSAGVDRVQLFYRNPSGNWVVQESGDAQPISSWPVPGRYPTFPLAQGDPAPCATGCAWSRPASTSPRR
jgi:hypothetical protein